MRSGSCTPQLRYSPLSLLLDFQCCLLAELDAVLMISGSQHVCASLVSVQCAAIPALLLAQCSPGPAGGRRGDSVLQQGIEWFSADSGWDCAHVVSATVTVNILSFPFVFAFYLRYCMNVVRLLCLCRRLSAVFLNKPGTGQQCCTSACSSWREQEGSQECCSSNILVLLPPGLLLCCCYELHGRDELQHGLLTLIWL